MTLEFIPPETDIEELRKELLPALSNVFDQVLLCHAVKTKTRLPSRGQTRGPLCGQMRRTLRGEMRRLLRGQSAGLDVVKRLWPYQMPDGLFLHGAQHGVLTSVWYDPSALF